MGKDQGMVESGCYIHPLHAGIGCFDGDCSYHVAVMNEPKKIDGLWTCPEGYEFPKCGHCGHNFYERKPVKGGDKSDICYWCAEEQVDGRYD